MRIGREEEEAVLDVLRSKRLFRYYGPTKGPSRVDALEAAFAEHMGTAYATAVSCGSASLIASLAAFGVGPGDEVIVPAYTWIASATAVVAVGAVPIIAEVDESLTLDPADVERKITPHTKAIIAVHMRGAPCDMNALTAIAQRHHLQILEDVAQAVGASYNGRRLGSIGDAGAFSLQFNKIITSGEGGMVVTDDDALHKRIILYHDVAAGPRNDIPREDTLPGVNLRMSELQGAVALVQLGRLDGLLAEMRSAKARIKAGIADTVERNGFAFRTINDPDGEAAVALVVYLSTVDQAHFAAKALDAEGVHANVLFDPDSPDFHIAYHWTPILQQRTWSDNGGPWRWHEGALDYRPDACPRSLDLLGRALHIDISPDLTDQQVEELTEALDKVLTATAARQR
jgi:dTDP-4-amino-4,6-dideoxygalactose transaminase